MIALRTLLLGALAATLLAIGPAHATPPCSHWKDGNALTVHGTITRTGPALKIVADHPLCGLGSLLNLGPNADGKMLDEKWLGMRVKIEGTPEEVGDNGTVLFTIKSIKDDGAADETYNYNCDLGKGRTSHLLVNATKNVLTWRGKSTPSLSSQSVQSTDGTRPATAPPSIFAPRPRALPLSISRAKTAFRAINI
jgi:hypothetical protein